MGSAPAATATVPSRTPLTADDPRKTAKESSPEAPAHRPSPPVWAWAVLLGLLTAASRIPFRSRYLFSWDSANFALALDHYNVAFHQPQPPGYPLYVASAWLARHVLGGANASYVALSIAASALAVVFVVMAAERLYGRTTAILAGILLATSSVFWSQGEVAYPYAFLACFSGLVGWLCLEVQAALAPQGPPKSKVQRAHLGVMGIGALLGLAAGFRSELLPFLAPLWVMAALVRPGRRRDQIVALAVGGGAALVVVALWYVPMVQRSGGWAAYQAATGSYYAYFIQTTSGAGKLLLGLLENTRALVGFLYNGLGLALVPMVYFLGRYFAPARLVTDSRARFVTLWLVPPLAFYVMVHIGNPGYVLSLLPALCIYGAQAALGALDDGRQAAQVIVERLARSGPLLVRLAGGGWVTPAAAVAVLLIGASNALIFRAADGEGRYREIRQIDRIFERQLDYVRRDLPAPSTLLVAYDRSRQYHYYLPEYRIELLFDVAVAGAVTDTSRYWERRTMLTVPTGISAVAFPDLGRNTSDQPGLVQRLELGEGVDLYLARVQPGDEVRYGYQYASATRR